MRRRKGFTLVELMVSMALTIFMMAILSEAFVVGLESFRKLRAMAELEQGMRTVESVLRRDLAANHFEGDKRLSELTVSGQRIPMFPYGATVNGTDLAPYLLKPPELGFFSIREGVYPAGAAPTPVSIPANSSITNNAVEFEGMDAMGSGKISVRDINDSLHFTVRLLGNKRENFFAGRVWPGSALDVNAGLEDSRFQFPGSATYSSQWAEVIYFVAPSGEPRPPGQPLLLNLYRRQLLLLPDAFTVYNPTTNPPTTIAPTAQARATVGAGPAFVTNLQDYHRNYDISAYYDGNYFWFNTPADVQFRQRRYAHHPQSGLPPANLAYPQSVSNPWPWSYPRFQDILGPTDPRAGAELVLPNVISFDVKILDPLPTSNPPSAAAFTGRQMVPPPSGTDSLDTNPNRFVDLGYGRNFSNGNQGPFVGPGNSTATTGGFVFDTWSTRNNGAWNYATAPAPYQIPFAAIQIKVRTWDRKTNQTRELTIIQDM